jgi:hypothetical protein
VKLFSYLKILQLVIQRRCSACGINTSSTRLSREEPHTTRVSSNTWLDTSCIRVLFTDRDSICTDQRGHPPLIKIKVCALVAKGKGAQKGKFSVQPPSVAQTTQKERAFLKRRLFPQQIHVPLCQSLTFSANQSPVHPFNSPQTSDVADDSTYSTLSNRWCQACWTLNLFWVSRMHGGLARLCVLG